MKAVAIAMLFLCGCASGDDTASLFADDAGSEAETSQQNLCCKVDKDIETDSALWQNYTYSCSANEPPWICDGIWDCNSPYCKISEPCHAFNGDGFVEECPEE